MHKGRELDDDKTLAEQGIDKEGAEIITVARCVAEDGKSSRTTTDSSTEEDDF